MNQEKINTFNEVQKILCAQKKILESYINNIEKSSSQLIGNDNDFHFQRGMIMGMEKGKLSLEFVQNWVTNEILKMMSRLGYND